MNMKRQGTLGGLAALAALIVTGAPVVANAASIPVSAVGTSTLGTRCVSATPCVRPLTGTETLTVAGRTFQLVSAGSITFHNESGGWSADKLKWCAPTTLTDVLQVSGRPGTLTETSNGSTCWDTTKLSWSYAGLWSVTGGTGRLSAITGSGSESGVFDNTFSTFLFTVVP